MVIFFLLNQIHKLFEIQRSKIQTFVSSIFRLIRCLKSKQKCPELRHFTKVSEIQLKSSDFKCILIKNISEIWTVWKLNSYWVSEINISSDTYCAVKSWKPNMYMLEFRSPISFFGWVIKTMIWKPNTLDRNQPWWLRSLTSYCSIMLV